MSEISKKEKKLLRSALGFDLRVKTNTREERRRATVKELRDRFKGEKLHPAWVLPSYARKPSAGKHPVRLFLHMAYVWEVLSLGLNLAFVCVLRDMRLNSFAARLNKARRGRPPLPQLTQDFSAQDDDAPSHVIALLRHACSLRPSTLSLQEDAEDLARILVEDSAFNFLEKLLERHEAVKGAEAWVQRSGSKGLLRRLAPPRKGLPDRVDLHPYRLSSFYELGKDLDLWR